MLDSRRDADLDRRHEGVHEGGRYLIVLEEQFQGLAEVGQRLIDCLALACHLDLQATRDEPLAVLHHGGSQCAGGVHTLKVPRRAVFSRSFSKADVTLTPSPSS